MLAKYDMTPLEVYDAVQKSNLNVGGDVIEKNSQSLRGAWASACSPYAGGHRQHHR